MFFSPSTLGFYEVDIHRGVIPDDAVEITSDYRWGIINGQCEGKRLVVVNGFPVLADPPKPTAGEMWTLIKAERDRRSEAGCLVAGHWFHNDLKSRTQWERMANRSAALADPDPYLVDGVQVAWKTMNGAFVPLTAGLIRQVVDAFEIQEVATFKAAEIHRAAMAAAGDPAAYDFSVGWPAIFAG